MAQLPLLQHAFAHAPVEVWEQIIDTAVRVSPPAGYRTHGGAAWSLDPLDPAEVQWDGPRSTIQLRYDKRDAARQLARNLSAVSQAIGNLIANSVVLRYIPLEWSVLSDIHPTVRGVLMHAAPRGTKGHYVKRIEFLRPPRYHRDNSNSVLEIIQECPLLEELICELRVDASTLLPALQMTCAATLQSLILDLPVVSGEPTVFELVTLLVACPLLETLRIGLIRPNAHPPPGGAPLNPPPPHPNPLALRTLCLHICESSDVLLEWLAQCDMPGFRHLKIDGDVRMHDFNTVPPGLANFLAAHGAKVRVLEMIEHYDVLAEVDGMGWELLDHCPNLQDFIFTIPRAARQVVSSPKTHATLRRVACHSFYLEHNGGEEAAERLRTHLDDVLGMVVEFCSGGYPELQLIRLLDLQPAFGGATDLTARDHDFADNYTQVIMDARMLCAANGVRFEDVLGQLVGNNFCLTNIKSRWDLN